MIAAEKANYPVAVMCRVLGVNRTSFHDWERRPPSDRALSDAWLTDKIERIHRDSRGVYGAPRIHAELRLEHGIRVGRKRVARLMKAAGIAGIRVTVQFWVSTPSDVGIAGRQGGSHPGGRIAMGRSQPGQQGLKASPSSRRRSDSRGTGRLVGVARAPCAAGSRARSSCRWHTRDSSSGRTRRPTPGSRW